MVARIVEINALAEFCVVQNTGQTPLDMAGYNLNAGDEGQDFVFPEGCVLEPGGWVKIWSRVVDAVPGDLHYGGNAYIWNNAGDIGVLTSPDGS